MSELVNVHLVDGTYELFRSFFGAPEAKAPDGREVGAVRGLLASLSMLLRDPDTSHVAVAFDTVIESFRNELFAGYKTGEGMEPALWQQFPLAERAVRALGCVVWPMIEFEADDGLAAGAVRFAADELFVTPPLQNESVILAHDPHAIVIHEGGFAGTWLPAYEAADFLARNCEWELPDGRPAFAQGAVAGIPTKLWLEDDQVLFIVPAPYAADFAERMEG